MDWDELESVLWQYYQGIDEPKISFEEWFYGDNGVRAALLNYHPEKKPVPEPHWEREIETRPIWARAGGK